MVNTCKVSGLRRNFDATLKRACESFIDPYNHTYKNVFCYMCNQVNLTSLTNIYRTECQSRDLDRESRNFQFSATIDLDSVQNRNKPSILICDNDYIPDIYSKLCRRIFCIDNGVLFKGNCRLISKDIGKTCLTLCLKLIALADQPAQFIKI